MHIVTLPKSISPEVYKKLIYLLIKEINTDFNILKSAFGNNDWKEVKMLSHKTIGASGSYSALEVQDLAKSLEISVNSIEDLNKNAIENLENAISKLNVYIKSISQQPNK